MRIGIDIDGVLTNLEQWQLDNGSKFFSKYNKSVVREEGYEIPEIFNVNEELDDEFWDEYLFEYARREPARKYASEVIKMLKDSGNEIYIITARYLTDRDTEDGQKMRKTVIDWLKKEDIIYDKIIFAPEDKLETCLENDVDVMIEDKVENIKKISTRIPVICFNASYNRNCKNDNIYRVYAWYGIYDLISNGKISRFDKN